MHLPVFRNWPRPIAFLSLILSVSLTPVFGQTDCADESPANDATLWDGYVNGPNGGELLATDVTDENAVCEEAMSFTVTVAQPNWWEGGFNYGQAQDLISVSEQRYRLRMRYRSTEDRNIYWRVIDRPLHTFGGATDNTLVEATLNATATYQDYTVEFTAPEADTVDHYLFFLGMMADNVAPVFIDDFSLEAIDDPVDCEEGEFNTPARWSSYACSGPAPIVGEVADENAVCGNAIFAELRQIQSSPFCAGLQINQDESPRFSADAEYRVRFRYRSDTIRTIYYRMVPRALDNSDGGAELVSIDLAATTDYRQFDTIVSSNPGQDSMLYHLYMNGDNLSRIYIDDFSMVQVGGACNEEDPTYNDPASYASYGGVTVTDTSDAEGVCGEALAIRLAATQSGPFDAGFEIGQDAALADENGTTYRVGFRYRALEARTAPILLTSRQRGTFGTDDGPQHYYEELNFTTDYQTFSHTFTSQTPEAASDRIVHMLLAVGSDTATIYLDSIALEVIIPERTDPTTLYVDPAGSDGNTGDGPGPDGAFQTLRYGLSQLIPGDTLLVADGVYAENNLRILGLIGTPERPTVVRAVNPWGAKIEGDIRYNINLQVENSRHVVVDGFEIYGTGRSTETNSATGLQIFRSDYVTLQNNYVHDCGCNGISGRESDYLTIQRNVARDNARFSEYNCSGFSIYQPRMLDRADGPHILIRQNVSFENEVRKPFTPLGFNVPTDGNGIILDDFNNTQSLGSTPNPYDPYVAETVVENNLVFGNGGAGIKAYEVENVIIRNNTTYHNNFVLSGVTTGSGEIILQVVGGEARIYNNVMVSEFAFAGSAFNGQIVGDGELELVNNLAVGDVVFTGDDPVLTENLIVTKDRRSYPRFAQARDSVFFQTFAFSSVDDFRPFFGLRKSSPGINAGANDLAPAVDLNGVARPIDALVDIGAYEGTVPGVGDLPADERLTGIAVTTPSSLEVDGIKDGLYVGPSYPITKLVGGAIENRSDLSGEWTAAYTPDRLYLLVEVNDDDPIDDDAGGISGDRIELYFDGNNAAGEEPDTDDYTFNVDRTGNSVIATGNPPDVNVAATTTETGYAVELSFAWSELSVTPEDSLLFGFDVRILDADAGQEAAAKLAWAASEDSGDIVPSHFGLLQLVEVEPVPSIAAARDTVNVDGTMDSTYAVATVYDLRYRVQPGIDDTTDFSGNWQALWDSAGLYFIVDITDDVLVNDSDNWYEDDGVEIYIDAGNEKETTYDGNDHQIVIEYGSDTIYDTKGNLGTGATSAIVDTEDGYTAEAFIPWSALGLDPAAGYFIGLDVHGIDDDAGGGGNDGKLAWFTTLDESYRNPSLFGTAFLGELQPNAIVRRPPAGDWLSISPNPTAGVLRYAFDLPRRGSLLLHDPSGRELLRQTVDGERGELRLDHLPNGVYLLSMRANDGSWARGRVVVAR
jgi:hypothetical protein